ncbi:MFS transporter [Rheinheimera sp. WS51]|uniref:MFS transporter n=1 Tax=Rheinheimera sp. WS51 TaxID=3425886 RepID=UPI003D926F14
MLLQFKGASEGMRKYQLMWTGQLFSILGSGLTSFALGLWILSQTDSVTSFTMIAVIAGLPGVLLAPWIGAIVDRYDRKLVMILSDTVSALVTLFIAVQYMNDNLVFWHIYVCVLISSIATAFQAPANIAAITSLVERKDYGRVSGLMQIADSSSMIVAPLLAGALLAFTDLTTVLLIDLATYSIAMITLILVKIPKAKAFKKDTKGSSLWQEFKLGWSYLFQHKDLVYLLVFFCLINFVVSMGTISVLPMMYFIADESQIGLALSIGGIGMLLGSFYLASTGGPEKKIHGILGSGFLMGFCLLLLGIYPSIWLIMIGLFCFKFLLPIINGSSQAIWQSRIPQGVQGRVFALRRMFAQFTIPLGDFLAGPLADFVFEPVMRGENIVSNSIGPLIGTGPGRGIALMLICLSIFPILFAIWGYSKKQIRNISEEPDEENEESESQVQTGTTTAASNT